MLGIDRALERALGVAYHYLNRRDRTVAEMRAYLSRRGIEGKALESALSVLKDEGYLDDCRYARRFADDKRELQGWGSGRIRGELLARGIDRDLVDATLPDEQADLERALSLLERRFPERPRTRPERDRALGFLLRRGYAPELALEAIRSHSRAA